MRTTVLAHFGAPGVLRCEEVAIPVPALDQMLVRVACCGVCGHDLLNRAGAFPNTPLPCVMGHEIAGTVEAVGSAVRGFRPGDRVALNQRLSCGTCEACRAGRDNMCRWGAGFYGEELSGGYGAFVVASARNAVILPDEIPFEVGAVLSCAVGTGFHALRRARLQLGDTVVVTAASGGVGFHTVKLARMMGLRVFAVSSSPSKAEWLRAADAEAVLDLDGFHKPVKTLTDGGADAVIEVAGSVTFAASLRSLKAGGRLMLVGNVEPGHVPLNPGLPILRELEILGQRACDGGRPCCGDGAGAARPDPAGNRCDAAGRRGCRGASPDGAPSGDRSRGADAFMTEVAPYEPQRPARSRWLDVRSVAYHVREWGTPGTKPLVLLHGARDASASFQFVDALAEDWHVLAPDWRGHGLTGWTVGSYWQAEFVADLDALLDALLPGQAVALVGHSMGGNIGSLYAGARPARVERLVMLDALGDLLHRTPVKVDEIDPATGAERADQSR